MAVCHYQVVVAVVKGTMCFIKMTKYVHLTMSVAGSLVVFVPVCLTGDRACQNNRALVSLPVSENVVAMVTLLSYYKKLDVCLPLIVSMSVLSPPVIFHLSVCYKYQ